ncbi:MAG: hypothetical protein LW699_04880 [Pirellula sp.]|jgi:hypothetical protein|nr:hypothetical protein [Pirellula sp.]
MTHKPFSDFLRRWIALVIIALVCTQEASAQSALGNPFKRAVKEVQEVPILKAEHGPWMIFAYSFEGEKSKVEATSLAKEIQRDLGLPTFIMEKKFDYSTKVLGSGYREDGSQKVMKYRDSRVVSGYAVLAGEFDSIDHPSVAGALEKIKTYQSRSLEPEGADKTGGSNEQPNQDSVRSAKKWLSGLSKDKPKGPLEHAFMTRNPLLPADFFQSPDLEKFVYDMNRQPGYNEHSLIDCKRKYTVRVLTFRGDSAFVSWGKSSADQEGQGASALEQAAERAYIAMKALRTAGYEAYQYHDREQSIVTVGGFEQLGTTDANNLFEYAPDIRAVMERFSTDGQIADTSKFDLNFGKVPQPRLLLDLVDQRKIPELYQGTRQEQLAYYSKLSIGFDLRPSPMAVPRYNASRIYAGSRLGGK